MSSTSLESLGLSKNEAEIYRVLLSGGELRPADLARQTKIHRRNIYDVIDRLMEKGLVIETIGRRETYFLAVDPNKLLELIEEKREALNQALPGLNALYHTAPEHQSVVVYRGVAGYERLLRAMLREGSDVSSLGSKGIWRDVQGATAYRQFLASSRARGMNFRYLCDPQVGEKQNSLEFPERSECRYLPPDATPVGGIEIFGTHVAIISRQVLFRLGDDFICTVIVNARFAKSAKTWFDLVWNGTPARRS